MKVHVEAYGCTLNRGEAGEFIDAFIGMGHTLAQGADGADAFAIFTCGVIETTERHMLKRVREFARSLEKTLLVCGCLGNICPDRILKIAPHAILVGPAQHMAALAHLGGPNRAPITPPASAIGMLPVATGCRGSCTYCITRHARGGLCSRLPQELKARLEKLVAAGAVEIQLCAQDTAAYGADIGQDMAGLTDVLAEVEGDYMIRIGMMNPASLRNHSEMIMKAYENPKVFKFLHLPVQSGSDSILASMNRNHTVDDFRELVKKFRQRFPGLALSTDIIIGFPGETDGDFRMSMELMKEIKPDIINVTRFSPRPGTEAHSLEHRVPGWKAKERSREMTELRFSLTSGNYSDMKGRSVRALATERRKPGTTFLRTPEYRPVVVPGELELGKWYPVRVTGRARTHLHGEIE